MKKKMISMAMMALMALTACTTDEPEPVIQNDPASPVLPVGDFKMWPTPTIDDSNLQGEGYTFDYWQAHKGEAQTGDELMAMCNVPNDLLKNMSTANLAWTCFNHPYMGNWLLFNDIYDGVLSVMTRFNGFEELMKRKGGAQSLIDLYCRLGCKRVEAERDGITLVEEINLASWVMVMCTAADYQAFSQDQVTELAKEMLHKRRIHAVSSTSHSWLDYTTYLLGGFIAYHYDETLPVEQQVLLANFIKYCCKQQGVGGDMGRSHDIILTSLQRLSGQSLWQ